MTEIADSGLIAPAAPARVAPTILFDLDGTLIDSLELLVTSMRVAFESGGRTPPPVEEWVAGIGRTLWWQFSQFAPEEELPGLVQRYRAYQSEHLDRLTIAYDGILELVRRLHDAGHLLGVVTSKADHLAKRSLDIVALSSYMDVIIGADSVAKHKPEPDPVLAALEQLGVPAGRAVYVGDSPYDIMAGNAAGVITVGVTWGACSRDALSAVAATHVVGSVAELERILSELRAVLAT